MGVYESLPVDPKLFAFRVYQLNKDGPLHRSGVKELSDFLIPPNHVYDNKIPFSTWISSNAGKELKLSVYSLSTQSIKDITVKVNETSGKEGYLGGAVKYENWVNAHKNALHVTNVKTESFGEKTLGLKPMEDYIIAIKPQGQDIITLNTQDVDPLTILSNAINAHKGKECDMFIFSETMGSRCVKFTLSTDPYFTLGIEAAYGKLHEFPVKRIEEDEEKNKLISANTNEGHQEEEVIEKIDTDIEPNRKEVQDFKEEVDTDKDKDKGKDTNSDLNKDNYKIKPNSEPEVIQTKKENVQVQEGTDIKDDNYAKTLEEKIKSPQNVFL